MNYFLGILICTISFLLVRERINNIKIRRKMQRFIDLRESALDISNRVVNLDPNHDLFDYILRSCIELIPQSDYGSILMYNEEGYLVSRASIGFNKEEIKKMRLKLEDSFLYLATDGALDKTEIINGLEQIVLVENTINSGDKGFVIRSEISSPLFINGELVGLLCVDADKEKVFKADDVNVIDYMSKQISAVIKNQDLYNEILFLSMYDSLTNLYNRTTFDKKVADLLNENISIIFMILDLDKLKYINDTYGHHMGDEIIRSFARQLSKYFYGENMCARYGGDEFVAFSRSHSLLELEEVMKKLEADLKKSAIEKDGKLIYPEFSYGMSLSSEGINIDDLYRDADSKMYLQKHNKK